MASARAARAISVLPGTCDGPETSRREPTVDDRRCHTLTRSFSMSTLQKFAGVFG